MSTKTFTHQPLSDLVQRALEQYFSNLEEKMLPNDLYEFVLKQVELPLLEITLKYTKGKQCRASELLGMNRSTLRKKLRHYALI